MNKIKETKALDDVMAMEKYNEILGKDMDRIVFGYKAIKEAFERKAIDILLVSDDFLRKLSLTHRKELTKMMKELEKEGAKINKMSSRHVTGESKLLKLYRTKCFGRNNCNFKVLNPRTK